VRQSFPVGDVSCDNLEVEIPGGARRDEIIVVGAHYDSVLGSPGANDNGSGVAAVLELARRWAGRERARTVRYVTFVNEEPPYFRTDRMGSLVYARRCRERGDRVVAMITLETMGCYRSDTGSQQYPFPVGLFYPSRGDFIAFVGNTANARLVRQCIRTFRERASFPSEGGALPGWLPGIGWSDHWAFWQAGFPGIMVTDTAPFRYAHYHSAADTPDKLDYDRLARVVDGMDKVLEELAGARR
jgi:Zn-dependent M28 family amino/carboxypeptidase